MTGANDVIDHYVVLWGKKPEFYQDDDFTVVLWSQEG